MPGSSSSEDDDRVEHLHFKLVLLGDQGVGKTAIARRLTSGEFDAQSLTPTVGVEFYKAELLLRDGIHATLQVWDVGSSVSSLSMAANYLHGCHAVLCVHDILQEQTFSQLCQWQDVLQQMFQSTGLPYMAVIANKADTDDLSAASAQLHAATSSISHACSWAVSAKTGRNIKSTFLCIAADLAGVPLTQQQLDAAADAGSSTGRLQQLRVDMPSSPGPVSPPVGSAGLRSRKPGSGADPKACSITPKQQAMQRTEQQDAAAGAEEEALEGTAAGLSMGPLKTCRCCCHCALM
ncbi:hypothetical protein OEZ85_010717 [Tetradesmus obliquus]|uniref:Uncharacterized protein n=1 Tax=Tetradesmus obliquus TaxID=3088 RepID=A0ABY8TN35_TETOB|nr:hypothetical protein OEZ85_010717 [Tetradesmus obliquus]